MFIPTIDELKAMWAPPEPREQADRHTSSGPPPAPGYERGPSYHHLHDPDETCPRCGEEESFTAEYIDVGPAMQQVEPSHCSNCGHIEGDPIDD